MWTPERLAEGTRYEQYRAAEPEVLRAAGFDLVLARIDLPDLQEIVLRRPGRKAVRAKVKR